MLFKHPSLLFLGLLAVLAPFANALAQASPPDILATQALVLDVESGQILHEKSPDEMVPVASLTKLMVTLLSLESFDLKSVVTVSQTAAVTMGATAQIEAGEQFYVEDLLRGLLLPSGNDVAVALAEHWSGRKDGFLNLMNERALQLGLANTQYKNVTGLDEGGGYSTARDLSKLAQKLLEYDLFRQIIQTETLSLTSLAGISRTITNTNQLLGDTIGELKVIGMKTGTTPNAGQCLIILAQNEAGKEVLIILLGSSDRYADATKMLEWVGQNIELGLPEAQAELTPTLQDWPFPDLSTYEPFFQTALELKSSGIIRGDDQTGLLRGNDPLNRAEMVAILLRAGGYDTPEEIQACAEMNGPLQTSRFVDVGLEGWYSPSVHCASNLDWVSGDDLPLDAAPNTLPTFRPGDPLNLPEAMKLLVESQVDSIDPHLNEIAWYDAYLNHLLNGNFIDQDHLGNYILTYSDVSLGAISDSVSRMSAFELLHRLMTSKNQVNSGFEPYVTVEDYQSQGAVLTVLNDTLSVTDPALGFELSGLPMEGFDLSEIKFHIQNPSGMEHDYYTNWSILYPSENLNKPVELFSLLIFDADYPQAERVPMDENGDVIFGSNYPLQFKCEANLNGVESELIALYHAICPQAKKSAKIILQ